MRLERHDHETPRVLRAVTFLPTSCRFKFGLRNASIQPRAGPLDGNSRGVGFDRHCYGGGPDFWRRGRGLVRAGRFGLAWASPSHGRWIDGHVGLGQHLWNAALGAQRDLLGGGYAFAGLCGRCLLRFPFGSRGSRDVLVRCPLVLWTFGSWGHACLVRPGSQGLRQRGGGSTPWARRAVGGQVSRFQGF